MQTAVKTVTIIEQTYQEKMDAIINMLETGIRDVFTSGRFQDYLKTMAKFYNYSFRNTFLIFMQREDATNVAGFYTWKKEFERSVNKGEKGIKILAPYSVKKSVLGDKKDSFGQIIYDPNTGKPDKELKTIDIQKFKVVTVFDILQTSGKPLPELVSELKANVDNADEIIKAICNVADCPIDFEVITNGAKGYYNPVEHRIAISKDMASLQTIKTMVHELAHARLHSKDCSIKKDRFTMEVEAESIAFCVLQFLGMDTASYSFSYLAGWSKTQELKELSGSLATIQIESDNLIKLISKELNVQEQEIPSEE